VKKPTKFCGLLRNVVKDVIRIKIRKPYDFVLLSFAKMGPAEGHANFFNPTERV